AEGVERGRPVRPAAHAAGAREQPEREDLLAEVAPVEPAPEDGLVHLLQLAEREAGREERVDEVGVRELGPQAGEGGADHGAVIVGEGWQACHPAPGGVRERRARPILKAAAVRAHPPSSSMRSSAAAARTRTSSGMVISGASARSASRVPSRVIIFMYWQSLQLL